MEYYKQLCFHILDNLSETNSLKDKNYHSSLKKGLMALVVLISVKKVEFLVENLLTKKSPDLDCFTGILPKEETVSSIYRLSQEIKGIPLNLF